MRRLLMVLATLGLAGQSAPPSPPSPPSPPFRIAVEGGEGGEGECRTASEQTPPAERAYAAHLAQRLGRPILLCPVRDRAAAAAALARGQVDLALLDRDGYGLSPGAVRAFATLRPKDGMSRIPVVVSTTRGGRKDIADLKGATIVFGGRFRAAYESPKRALVDLGAGDGYFASEIVTADHQTAVEALRSGRAQVMVLHASAQRRLCRPASPGEQPCGDLVELWRGRPRAELALAVRKDMADLDRHRLLGIHLALHMENPTAFAWASAWSPGATEFEPAEADALEKRL